MNSPSSYVGLIGKARLPYYDLKKQKIKFKSRPVVIIGCEKDAFPCDFTLLPLSRVSKRKYIDEVYDIKINQSKCEQYNLNSTESYIRTHKVFTCHFKDIAKDTIYDLKSNDPEMYNRIIAAFKMFSEDLFY